MKHLLAITMALLTFTAVSAQTEQANAPLTATSKKRVAVHDPSVVYNSKSKRYYIFYLSDGNVTLFCFINEV